MFESECLVKGGLRSIINERTMNLVLMTHRGFVHVVLAAPAIMADIICNPQGCSLATGW